MEKGNDDGLFISSVACCQELWALIMDAGTGFNAQASAASRPMHAVGKRGMGPGGVIGSRALNQFRHQIVLTP